MIPQIFKVVATDTFHVLQKYTVTCDTCFGIKSWTFLVGGGLRECWDCHLKNCDHLKLEIIEEELQ